MPMNKTEIRIRTKSTTMLTFQSVHDVNELLNLCVRENRPELDFWTFVNAANVWQCVKVSEVESVVFVSLSS